MKLLSKKELHWSPIVANNTMNRERGVVGVNSYDKDLKFNCLSFLEEQVRNSNSVVRWLDLCCGKGRALLQADKHFQQTKITSIELEGWDLIDGFENRDQASSSLTWHVGNLEEWQSNQTYDLITCVHGLHYIGDKLQLIKNAVSCLKEHGTFIANIDFNNIKYATGDGLGRKLSNYCRQEGLEYHAKNKVLTSVGAKSLNFQLKYLGADDQAGPNYTGQAVVDSYYEVEEKK